jgi:flavin reductase (DIM6/NTAB) family NADH-FMN oxidoreductase RutF
MTDTTRDGLITLDTTHPIWERFFMVAPLVLVGSKDPGGTYNVAPKHLALPLGWEHYYGFVCSPRHHTYRNVVERGPFTVSFPCPGQVLATSLAAAPRWDDDSKPGLQAVGTFPARMVDGVLVQDCYAYLECQLDRVVDGFGANSLIVGRIVAAHVAEAALRTLDRDDNDLVRQTPLLAYVSPGRFARIDEALAFPFPAGFER